MIADLEPRFLGHPAINLFIHWFIHIKNTAASLASEVIVAPGITIKPALVIVECTPMIVHVELEMCNANLVNSNRKILSRIALLCFSSANA